MFRFKTSFFNLSAQIILLVFFFCVGCLCRLSAQVRFVIENLPANTPSEAPVYVAGNFNGWNPGDPAYKMELDSAFRYTIQFAANPGILQFKFTRGSWATVEGGPNGGFRPNRTLAYNGADTTIRINIESWEDLGGSGGSTASPNFSIWTDSFYMAGLNRYRRIWLYLPEGYEESQDSFPVIYLQDGQNLFDVRTAFAGEWRVDESLDSLAKLGRQRAIVVGMDNGGARRIDEYTPWRHPVHGGGHGEDYVQFMVEELKPYVDQQLRTRKDARNTAIGGSSLGGLISLYAALRYPDVFGNVVAFSSSFWFSDSIYRKEAYVSAPSGDLPRLYLIAGALEGGQQVGDMYRFRDSLLVWGWPEESLFAEHHPDGRHNEAYWAREFPDAYTWLFPEPTSIDHVNTAPQHSFTVLQSEADILLQAGLDGLLYQVTLHDLHGKLVGSFGFEHSVRIPSQGLRPGMYVMQVAYQGHPVWSNKLTIRR
jgi:metallo-beta-lactamase class B